MKETALAFTDFASYCLTYILLVQNSMTFPRLLFIFQISLTNFKISWLFPDLEKNSFSPDFSLTVGTLTKGNIGPAHPLVKVNIWAKI